MLSARVTERVERPDNGRGHVDAAMPGIIEDDETAHRPRPVQVPGGVQRARYVIAAVDEDRGDPGDPGHVAGNRGVVEKAAVAPVVRHRPGEYLPERRVLVAQPRLPARHQRDVGVLPDAP